MRPSASDDTSRLHSLCPALTLLLDREVELELGRELLLAVQAVREVDPPDAAVGVDLDPQGLHVVRPVRPPREVRQVELDLVPALVQPQAKVNILYIWELLWIEK